MPSKKIVDFNKKLFQLGKASNERNVHFFQELLDKVPENERAHLFNAREIGRSKVTLLLHSITFGSCEIAKRILAVNGVDPNIASESTSPLLSALCCIFIEDSSAQKVGLEGEKIREDYTQIVRILLEKGADIYFLTPTGDSIIRILLSLSDAAPERLMAAINLLSEYGLNCSRFDLRDVEELQSKLPSGFQLPLDPRFLLAEECLRLEANDEGLVDTLISEKRLFDTERETGRTVLHVLLDSQMTIYNQISKATLPSDIDKMSATHALIERLTHSSVCIKAFRDLKNLSPVEASFLQYARARPGAPPKCSKKVMRDSLKECDNGSFGNAEEFSRKLEDQFPLNGSYTSVLDIMSRFASLSFVKEATGTYSLLPGAGVEGKEDLSKEMLEKCLLRDWQEFDFRGDRFLMRGNIPSALREYHGRGFIKNREIVDKQLFLAGIERISESSFAQEKLEEIHARLHGLHAERRVQDLVALKLREMKEYLLEKRDEGREEAAEVGGGVRKRSPAGDDAASSFECRSTVWRNKLDSKPAEKKISLLRIKPQSAP